MKSASSNLIGRILGGGSQVVYPRHFIFIEAIALGRTRRPTDLCDDKLVRSRPMISSSG